MPHRPTAPSSRPLARRRTLLLPVVASVALLAGCTAGSVDTGGASSSAAPRSSGATAAAATSTADGPQPTITLAFAGDTQAYGSAGRINTEGLGATGKVLASADLAMVNLETAVADDRSGLVPQPKPFTFVTGPQILDTLKREGVDVVTAANNHSMDFGMEGMRRMLQVKARSPLPIVGIGKDADEAWAPWSTQVKGRRVVVFGATDVLDDTLDWKAGPGTPGLAKVKDADGFQRLLDGVRKARAAGPHDVVVVYLHSGIEKHQCPTPRQVYTDTALAQAGADVVIGSHAHMLQPATTIGHTAVEYGMGNFVFGSGGPGTKDTGVLTVTVPGSGTPTMDFTPARVTDGLPVLVTGSARDTAVQRWRDLGKGCS